MARLLFLIPAFCILSIVSCAQEQKQLTDQEKLADLALLWSEAKYNFVYFDKVPNLDWDKTYEKFIPKVLATESNVEYVRLLQEFYALLNEGHTNVVPPLKYHDEYGVNPPLELDVIEGQPVVINVIKNLSESIPIGSVILAVDGITADVYLEEHVLPYISAATDHDRLRKAVQGGGEPAIGLLTRPANTSVNITFEKPDGDIKNYQLTYDTKDTKYSWVQSPKNEMDLFNIEWLEDDIVLIEINEFTKRTIAEEFEQAIPDLKKADGFIFDVRKNSGGSSSIGFAIGNHFTDQMIIPSIWSARKHISAYKAWGKYSDREELRQYFEMRAFTNPDTTFVEPSDGYIFDQPVVVLSGSDVYSAAEDFLSYMNQIPRVKIIGKPSAGSTGQPLILQLKAAFAAITTKRDVQPDGTPIVGNGIQPDIEVTQTIQAFREGRDLVLERAIEMVQNQINN